MRTRGSTPSALRAPPPAKLWEGERLRSTNLLGELSEGLRGPLRAIALLIFLLTPAFAVEPDEILKDPALEARARSISEGLRCLVCQNQSIDDSDATVAKDLRILIREQLQQKKSDAEVIDFVVARYGEFVLLKPRFRAGTLVLWLTPFLILALAVFFAFRRKTAAKPEALTSTEKAEVEAILRK
jgi:cytochrome c-type biogenesis protein CcmH